MSDWSLWVWRLHTNMCSRMLRAVGEKQTCMQPRRLRTSRVHVHTSLKPRPSTPLDNYWVQLSAGLVLVGLCALRHGIQISMEAILDCHPARSTEWLDCHPKSCELLPWPKKLKQPRARGTGAWSVEHAHAYVWLACLFQFFWPG